MLSSTSSPLPILPLPLFLMVSPSGLLTPMTPVSFDTFHLPSHLTSLYGGLLFRAFRLRKSISFVSFQVWISYFPDSSISCNFHFSHLSNIPLCISSTFYYPSTHSPSSRPVHFHSYFSYIVKRLWMCRCLYRRYEVLWVLGVL